jgi:hypothetical protein
VGIAFSIFPVLSGFTLFLMGASLVELILFAIASSTSVILWGASEIREDQADAGNAGDGQFLG